MMNELLLNIENGPLRRDNTPSPRLIKDSTVPPEVHRIVIEFNEKTNDTAEAEVGDKESNKQKISLRRQPSSNLQGYMSA